MNVNYITFWTTRPRLHEVRAMSILSFLSSIQDLGCFFVFASRATYKTLCFLCVHLEQNPKTLCVLLKHPRRCVFLHVLLELSRIQDIAFLMCSRWSQELWCNEDVTIAGHFHTCCFWRSLNFSLVSFVMCFRVGCPICFWWLICCQILILYNLIIGSFFYATHVDLNGKYVEVLDT